jgi:hypothetical protein
MDSILARGHVCLGIKEKSVYRKLGHFTTGIYVLNLTFFPHRLSKNKSRELKKSSVAFLALRASFTTRAVTRSRRAASWSKMPRSGS